MAMKSGLFGCVIMAMASCSSQPALAGKAIVTHIVDGDTFEIAGHRQFGLSATVRVRGIDTPESRFPQAKCEAERIAGKLATAFAAEMLAESGGLVWLSGKSERDVYGRFLFTVRVRIGGKSVDWGKHLIQAGLAQPYLPTKTSDGRTLLIKPDWCAILAPSRLPAQLLPPEEKQP